MGRMARDCVQSALKLVNAVLGMVGMGMILFALWMLRSWSSHGGGGGGGGGPAPWFVYSFLGLGIFLCMLTCSGHVAAETANGHCLSCYMVFIFLLLALEAGITADVLLNRYWEEDFPADPTGGLDKFKDFVRSNFELCKWVGLLIVATQALSVILAIVLRILGPDDERYDDSDDDSVPARLPLLRNQVQHAPAVADTNMSVKNDTWTVRIPEKVNR